MGLDEGNQQYPAVRKMRICLSCGGPKHVGLLVCWQCHNDLKMKYDLGYGSFVEHVLRRAEQTINERDP